MDKQITFLADEKTRAKLEYVDRCYHAGGLAQKERTRSETLRLIIDEAYFNIVGNSDAYLQFWPSTKSNENSLKQEKEEAK